MAHDSEPLVSVATPVYNGATFLAECIESVLAQTYQHWTYTIVDNRSTDATPDIARRYAEKDPRIRVVRNDRFLPIMDNHNAAFRQTSPEAAYCKVLFADDWLYPTCLQEMVAVGERYPHAGIIGAYGTDGTKVLWTGLHGDATQVVPPYTREVVPGSTICRQSLLGGPYVFGSATSLLYRADLVRERHDFFNPANLHGDLEACYETLRRSDFGFVHQILTFTRMRDDSQSAAGSELNAFIVGDLVALLKYGPVFLTQSEYDESHTYLNREYHRVLGRNVLRLRAKSFWTYHETMLAAYGGKIDRALVAKMAVADALGLVRRPASTLRGGWRWWTRRLRDATH